MNIEIPGVIVDNAMELAAQEAIIEHGFASAGEAYAKIRDERLYKSEYHSFDSYCRERWNLSRDMVDRIIGGVKVLTNCQHFHPANEGQARELKGLEPDAVQAVMEEAQKHGKVTASTIKTARLWLDIRALSEQGKSIYQICTELGTNDRTVRRALKSEDDETESVSPEGTFECDGNDGFDAGFRVFRSYLLTLTANPTEPQIQALRKILQRGMNRLDKVEKESQK